MHGNTPKLDHASPADLSFEERLDLRKPRRPRDPAIRPSHLHVRRYFPTHPLLNIAWKLPAKLTRQDWERLETQRILAKFDQWTRQNALN